MRLTFRQTHLYRFVNMVRPTGFEPAAYRVGVCHSIQLSYGRIFCFISLQPHYYTTFPAQSKENFSLHFVKKVDNFAYLL